MKIAIFDPYLDTLGGGERYVATIAEYLSKNHEVHLLWDDQAIKNKLMDRLNLDLSNIQIVPNIFSGETFLKRSITLKTYDRFLYLSDGSLPYQLAKKNFLHFQFPINWIKNLSLNNRIKLSNYQEIICNSYFTKKFIDKTYKVYSKVVYPPIDTNKFLPQEKDKLIISVGRFTKILHDKKQELLIDAFKKLYDSGVSDWRLIIAGGMGESEKNLLEELQNMAKGYPIKLLVNITFKELRELYGKASIYWHAAGLGEDVENHPEKTEHFGIAIVEAMSAGCVPFTVNNGGPSEIIEEDVSGLFFNSIDDLVTKTKILTRNQEKLKKISQNAIARSKKFSKERFCQEIRKVMEI